MWQSDLNAGVPSASPALAGAKANDRALPFKDKLPLERFLFLRLSLTQDSSVLKSTEVTVSIYTG